MIIEKEIFHLNNTEEKSGILVRFNMCFISCTDIDGRQVGALTKHANMAYAHEVL